MVHQAGADLLARLRPGRLDAPHLFREVDDPGVTLVISDLTPHPATDTIAWKPGTGKDRVFAVVSASRTTDQLNVVLNRMDDELHVTACFVDGAFDPVVVRGALASALSDPPVSA